MQIDWITVSAQIVNFLLLVWLLKRFLYRPVIHAMDRREQVIANRQNEAEQRKQQAGEMIQRYQDKTDELQQQRDNILAAAKEEAEQRKKQLLDEAREQVADSREQWRHQADQEGAEFLDNLRRQTAETVHAIARKALRDLADAGLEDQIVQRFIEHLQALDKNARKALVNTSEPVRIASAFKLDSAARSRLTRAIHQHLEGGIEVDYGESPELLCGIELSRGSQHLSWNLAAYMDELKTCIDRAFDPTAPDPQVEA